MAKKVTHLYIWSINNITSSKFISMIPTFKHCCCLKVLCKIGVIQDPYIIVQMYDQGNSCYDGCHWQEFSKLKVTSKLSFWALNIHECYWTVWVHISVLCVIYLETYSGNCKHLLGNYPKQYFRTNTIFSLGKLPSLAHLYKLF